MKRICRRTISSLLAVFILFSSMDLNALAYSTDEKSETYLSADSVDDTEMDEPAEGVSEEMPSIDDEENSEADSDETSEMVDENTDPLSDTEEKSSTDEEIENIQAEEGDKSSMLGTNDYIVWGVCGYNLIWGLKGTDNELTLHISGTGEMYDYANDTYESEYYVEGPDYTIDDDGNPIGIVAPWYRYRDKIVACEIHQGVTKIGKLAFCLMPQLVSVKMPSSLTSIGTGAFSDCTSLGRIVLPNSLKSIGDAAFSDCISLVSIELPNSLTSIGDYAFSDCKALTGIEVPSSVKSMGDGVFCRCWSLVDVVLPPTLTSIGEAFFAGCKFTSIEIPSTVTSIGFFAFDSCENLTSIKLPDALTNIGGYAFYSCTNLTSIEIPSTVKDIGDGLFWGCSSLTSMKLPPTMTSIGRSFFQSCSSLRRIEIPSTVTYIEERAFKDCSSLKDVYYRGSESDFQKISIDTDNDSLKNATIHYNSEMPGIDDRHVYSSDDGFKFFLSGSEKDMIELGQYNYGVDLYDFFNSSYDHDATFGLTKMSLRVAMAAMDCDSYTKTDNRALLIRGLMNQLEFQYDETDIRYVDPQGNSIGTAIGSRTVERGDEQFTLVMVAVRGGGYLNEWAGNGNVGQKNNITKLDHYGFELAANTVIEDRIKAHLKNHNITDLGNVKIWICGYSRAAAVSNLVAAKLDDGAISGIKPENVFGFCFECPNNTLNRSRAQHANIINIINLVDFIPYVAPNTSDTSDGWNYSRFGTTYYINDGNNNRQNFNKTYSKMRSNYQNMMGKYYSPERLKKQLDCYEGLVKTNTVIIAYYGTLLRHLIKAIPNRIYYVDRYQDKIYQKIETVMDKGFGIWDWITIILSVVKEASGDLDSVGDYLTLILGLNYGLADVAGWGPVVYRNVPINHYAELTLAWVDALDKSDYIVGPASVSAVFINCPVDVTVRDSSNNIVASIIKDEVQDIEDGLGAYVDEDGQKVIIIPSDDTYTIESVAYDSGDVSITTVNYEIGNATPKTVDSYLTIPVEEGDIVSAVCNESSVTVTDNEENILSPTISQSGENITSYSVTAITEGPGSVEGGGVYNAGEYCKVSATPDEGKSFVGWYENGEPVSYEREYRFMVLKDTRIEGVFADEPIEPFSVKFGDASDDSYDGLCYNSQNDHFEINYTGYAIRPAVVVTGANGVLTEGVDYTVSYSNNTNYNAKEKPAKVTVTGKGNYSGKYTLNFYVLQADLAVAKEKGLLEVPDEITLQSGKKVSPIIRYGSYTLKSSDMIISDKNAIKTDTTIDITGKGNFTGTLENIYVKVIPAADVKSRTIKVTLKQGIHTYNGFEHELTYSTSDEAGELTVTAGSSKIPLVKDQDYLVTYKSNISAGTATVMIKGTGDYLGEVTKTFKIQPDKASDITADLDDPEAEIPYSANGSKPTVKVTVNRADSEPEELKAGKDYTVSYSNNKKVGTGKYTVSFIGNYKGHAAIKNKAFTITAASFKNAKAESADMIYYKPGKYLSVPYVSLNGVQLTSKDYSVRYFDGDKELTNNIKLSLDSDTGSKLITVKVVGKGNYKAEEITTVYEVKKMSESTVDLSKTRIVAREKNSKGKDVNVGKQEYTGSEIKPEIRVLRKVNKVWEEVPSSSYRVRYINNVNRGNATILVTGDGLNSVGSISAKFSIGTKNIGFLKWLKSIIIH